MLLDKFKNKNNNKEKENVEMIAVPDLRDYILKGYDEIREVKKEKEDIEKARNSYKKEAEDNRKLYETALVTADEFKKRDTENQSRIKDLNYTINNERENYKTEIENKNNEINTLKEKVLVLEEIQGNLNKKVKQDIIKRLIEDVKKQKGNLSKEKVLTLINNC